MGGELRLYRGTGTGGVGAGVKVGTGWQAFPDRTSAAEVRPTG